MKWWHSQANVLKPDFIPLFKDIPTSVTKVADEQSVFMNGPFSERKLK
jgi:hypothetical protein